MADEEIVVISKTISGHRSVDFDRINRAALRSADSVLVQWLPDGRREGNEWVSRNPKRVDEHLGSFKVNLRTGRWGDFAVGAGGGDLISLGAYLSDLSQVEAAVRLAEMLGVSTYEY